MLKITVFVAAMFLLVPLVSSSYAQEFKTFSGVGKDAGDGTTTFDVQYSSTKDIVTASVKEKEKSVNFVLVGKIDSNSTLVMRLPTGLISGPFIGVWQDGKIITNYTVTNGDKYTEISMPITPMTENISIVGTKVVPEFGAASVIVLSVLIVTIVAITRLRPVRL